MSLIKDMSVSAVTAGFVAVLVGFASSVSIVIQAAQSAGADAELLRSWITALGLGMGLSCIFFSWYYKKPIITAWSTPGAALLVTSLNGLSYAEAIGAFIAAGLLTLLVGLSGFFNRLMAWIPYQIACAMLAGILFQFALAIFNFMAIDYEQILILLVVYLIAKQWVPRYAIIMVLIIAMMLVFTSNQSVAFEMTWSLEGALIWQTPEFNIKSLLGVALPLFIVTMTAQNLPGIVALKAHKIEVSNSTLISWTGVFTLILAPFGGFAFNLAAITAAICMGEESHPDPAKRYIAGLSAGVFYCLAALSGAGVVALFSFFPQSIIVTIAGLALLSTIADNLKTALTEKSTREAALITFLVSLSDIAFFDLSPAFWGLIFGLVCYVKNKR